MKRIVMTYFSYILRSAGRRLYTKIYFENFCGILFHRRFEAVFKLLCLFHSSEIFPGFFRGSTVLYNEIEKHLRRLLVIFKRIRSHEIEDIYAGGYLFILFSLRYSSARRRASAIGVDSSGNLRY